MTRLSNYSYLGNGSDDLDRRVREGRERERKVSDSNGSNCSLYFEILTTLKLEGQKSFSVVQVAFISSFLSMLFPAMQTIFLLLLPPLGSLYWNIQLLSLCQSILLIPVNFQLFMVIYLLECMIFLHAVLMGWYPCLSGCSVFSISLKFSMSHS